MSHSIRYVTCVVAHYIHSTSPLRRFGDQLLYFAFFGDIALDEDGFVFSMLVVDLLLYPRGFEIGNNYFGSGIGESKGCCCS